MIINPDDPKWTAYVLGELSETERAAVEAELESSEEARSFVEELRLAASVMKESLASEGAFGLTPEQRAKVHASANRTRRRWFAQPVVWAAGLAAAAIMVAAAMLPLLKPASAPRIQAALSAPPVESAAAKDSRETATLPQKAAAVPANPSAQAGALSAESSGSVAPASPSDPASSAKDELKQSVDALQAGPAALNSIAKTLVPSPQTALVPTQIRGAGGACDACLTTGVLGGVIRAPEVAEKGAAFRRDAPANLAVSAPVAPFASADRVISPDQPTLPPNPNNYDPIRDNPFVAVSKQPLATFSVDVDTASYANVRRFLNQNQMPPRDAVRIEELVNYFTYDYPQASGPHPITASMEVAAAPWNPQHRLVRVGIKAKEVRMGQQPSNLVFLIDVSGSMNASERLPLLKSGLHLLVDKLTESDRVSIVTYASGSGIALQPTSGDRKDVIARVIDNLHAEGSTNGGAGIQTAYELAVANFIRGGVNRVILATDGDFNVGVTDTNELTRLVEDRAKSGVYLSVLGFGNNFRDSLLGRLSDKGHGNYAYIDTLNEARKVLVDQKDATLVTVAKDVKIQIEFNPARVASYRLLGYENRLMRAQDFNDDRKDAGDVGSGHTVTALFEVVPPGVDIDGAGDVQSLRYQQPPTAAEAPRAAARDAAASNELLDLRIRYKDPDSSESKLLETPLLDRGASFSNASTDFRFAAAVAGFGMVLRDSPYKGSATLDWALATASASRGADKSGYREEFVRLVQRAIAIRR